MELSGLPSDDRPNPDLPDREDFGEVTVKISRPHRSAVRGRTIPTLRVVAGRDMLRYAPLVGDSQVVVGRDETADLRLTDVTVSKRHARVISDGAGAITVEDMQSTNGTAVNGKPITRALLRPGDHLEVGGVSLRLDLLTMEELGHLHRVVQRLASANRDPLTGLLTRAYLDEELPQLVERCGRAGLPLCCAFVDIDRFKDINDRYGHQVGDEVLVTIARLLMYSVRENDPTVRFGGEEVVIFLPGSAERGGVDVAERIRRAVAGHDWQRTAPGLRVTASFGVAEHDPDEDVKAWLKRADLALYDAKRAGRNRVSRSSMVST